MPLCTRSRASALAGAAFCSTLLLAPETALAFPGVCDTPEQTLGATHGIYGGAWGIDSAAPTGTLLGCRLVSNLWSGESGEEDDFVDATARAYQMRYVTRNAANRSVPATALVIVPKVSKVPAVNQGKAPLIALASGTAGVADACSPSITVRSGTSNVGSWVDHYLEKGLTVLVVDYIGLGTDLSADGTDHPYLEGRSSGNVLLDAVEAARSIPGAHFADTRATPTDTIPTHWPVALSGYSQGGASTLWAALRAPSYASTLPLRATVSGAPPVDLRATALQASESIARSLIAYFLLGFANATDPATLHASSTNLAHLDGFLKPLGRDLIDAARVTCAVTLGTSTALDALFGGYSLDQLIYKDALFADARFGAWLNQNSVIAGGVSSHSPPSTPLFTFHGALDGVVPYTPHKTLVVDQWGATQGSALISGEAALPRVSLAFQPAALGAHFTTSPLERNNAMSGYRYTPYEWVWDGLYQAARTNPDLTP